MKLLKFTAIAIGALVTSFGFISCNKEECCTNTLRYQGNTYKVIACEDGSLTYSGTYADGTSYNETGEWTGGYFDSWAELKEYMLEEYGATCD